MGFSVRRRRFYQLLFAFGALLILGGFLTVRFDRVGPIEAQEIDRKQKEPHNAEAIPTPLLDSLSRAVDDKAATVRMWAEVGPASGTSLNPTALATKIALLQQRALAGRSSVFSFSGTLVQRGRGERVELALPGGGAVTGTINLVSREPSGAVRVGGSLDEGGGFSLIEEAGRLHGRIVRPQSELAYVIDGESSGEVRIGERWLSTVLCFNLPGEPRVALAAPSESGPMAAPPLLSSRPSATAVLYLDFDGETVTDPDWNGGATINAAPSNLSSSQIEEVWRRVTEDFEPFDVDVTTDLTRYQNAPVGQRMRVIVTPTNDWAPKDDEGNPVGGVAYLDSFARAGTFEFTSDVPAWVFNTTVVGVAEAISHELGHTFGLSHDGRSNPAEEYFAGHGSGSTSWAPIMGVSYYRTITQWSKGEYAYANNQEDDVAIIAGLVPTPKNGSVNLVGVVSDEAGDSRESAVPIGMAGGAISQSGVIASEHDVDYYAFSTSAATITINANPTAHSANLDLHIELQDAAGIVLATANPDQALNATLVRSVSAGSYYLAVRGTGRGNPSSDGYSRYGSLGRYNLNGWFDSIVPVITSASSVSVQAGENFYYAIVATQNPTRYEASGLPPGLSLDANTGVIGGRPTQVGTYPVSLSVINAYGTGTGVLTINVANSAPVVLSQTSGRQVVAMGGSLSLNVSAYSSTGAVSYQWMHNNRPIPGANGPNYSLSGANASSAGAYWLVMTNAAGTTRSAPIFVVVPTGLTQVMVWGEFASQVANVPPGLNDIVQVATGGSYAMALRGNGTVATWGSNNDWPYTNPGGATGIVAISAFGTTSVGLRQDGTVVRWSGARYGEPAFPSHLSGIFAVSAGSDFGLLLGTDGVVRAWGSNNAGQGVPPPDLGNVIAIAAGGAHCLALQADGTVRAWGANYAGQSSIPGELNQVIAISAGDDHSLALKSDGTVIAWGGNGYGQTNVPQGLSGVVEISAGARLSIARRADGTIIAWGDGRGFAGLPANLTGVLGVDARGSFTMVIRNAEGETKPQIVSPPASRNVAEGEQVTFSVTAGGVGILSYQWQKNGVGIVGATSPTYTMVDVSGADQGEYRVLVTNFLGTTVSPSATLVVNTPPVVSNLSSRRTVLGLGDTLSLSVSASGVGSLRYQWRRNGKIIAGATGATLSIPAMTYEQGGWYHVDVSDNNGTKRSDTFFVIVAPNGTPIPPRQVRGWENNWLTEHDLSSSPAPDDVIQVVTPRGPAHALRNDGTVVRLGPDTDLIVPPDGLSGVTALAAGPSHILALKSDGTVVGWGTNQSNQIAIPEGLNDVVAIAAGHWHSLALKADGTVVAWGSNPRDQLNVPPGLKDVVAISADAGGSLALKKNGTLVGWGTLGASGQQLQYILSHQLITNVIDIELPLILRDDGSVLRLKNVFPGHSERFTVLPDAQATTEIGAGELIVRNDGSFTLWSEGKAFVDEPIETINRVLSGSFASERLYLIRDARFDSIPTVALLSGEAVLRETETARFTAEVSGAGPWKFQWRKNGANIEGATAAELLLEDLVEGDTGTYDVVVSNYKGSTTSAGKALTVLKIPVIAEKSPARTVVSPGEAFSFEVSATGKGAISYQWTKNGLPIPGATSPVFSRADVGYSDAGWYHALVTDENGTRRSRTFFVIVAPRASQLIASGLYEALWRDALTSAPSDLAAISGIDSHLLGLRADGTVMTWGISGLSPLPVPPGLSDVVAVAAGKSHSIALCADGTVRSWRKDSALAVVSGLRDIVAIAAHEQHSVALRSDGRVFCFWDESGRLMYVPADLPRAIQIAAGFDFTLAMDAMGRVFAWPLSDKPRTLSVTGGYTPAQRPITLPQGLEWVSTIAAGRDLGFAGLADGSIRAWRYTSGGREDVTVPVSLRRPFAVALGSPSLVIGTDRSVATWNSAQTPSVTEPTGVGMALGVAAVTHAGIIFRDASGGLTPAILAHPVDASVARWQEAQFAVTASGTGQLSYRWQSQQDAESAWVDLFDGITYGGTASNKLAIRMAESSMQGARYRCVVSNREGSTFSNAATLAVQASAMPPLFDAMRYGNLNPDVKALFAGMPDANARLWLHYLETGVYAGRTDGDFDARAYLEQYPELKAKFGENLSAAAMHWYTIGRPQGWRIPAGFDVESYFEMNPVRRSSFLVDRYGAWLYYRDVGIFDGEVYDDLFRPEEYLALYPELLAALGPDLKEALLHWLGQGRIEGRLGRIPLEFDAAGYFERNPDVAAAVGHNLILGWQHFWNYGIYEGRAYDEEFRVFEYLALNQDLQAAFLEDWRGATLHWLRYGRTEGRLGRVPLIFNVDFYLGQYPDVESVFGRYPSTVFQHYYFFGVYEARIFDNEFRVDEYIAINPDLQAVFGTDRRGAFMHWVRWGRSEGRAGRN